MTEGTTGSDEPLDTDPATDVEPVGEHEAHLEATPISDSVEDETLVPEHLKPS